MSEFVIGFTPIVMGALGYWLGRRDERRKWWPCSQHVGLTVAS